ncbi:MAG: hypothetical protein Q9162_004373 [Coniocarpon cinnabarinum]
MASYQSEAVHQPCFPNEIMALIVSFYVSEAATKEQEAHLLVAIRERLCYEKKLGFQVSSFAAATSMGERSQDQRQQSDKSSESLQSSTGNNEAMTALQARVSERFGVKNLESKSSYRAQFDRNLHRRNILRTQFVAELLRIASVSRSYLSLARTAVDREFAASTAACEAAKFNFDSLARYLPINFGNHYYVHSTPRWLQKIIDALRAKQQQRWTVTFHNELDAVRESLKGIAEKAMELEM